MIGAVSMKKTALALLCALLLALALGACGQDAAEPSSVPSAEPSGPVSYTHLDVYKRQGVPSAK